MEFLDAVVARARTKIQRNNNARRLLGSERCRRFVNVIDRCMSSRREIGSIFSLVSIEDAIANSIDAQPRSAVYGDHLFNNIVHTINNYRSLDGQLHVLRLDQQKMVAYILSACLPMIYKNDLEVHKDRILRILKAPKIYELLLILASRRVGKTTCIASVAAALIICMPEITMTIFANVLTGSKRVMKMIVDFLNKDARGRAFLQDKTRVQNQGQMILQDHLLGKSKTLEVYAATTNVCFLLFFVIPSSSYSFHCCL